MPKPTKSQSQEEFLKVCIPQLIKDKTAKNETQAVAICISIYNQEKDND